MSDRKSGKKRSIETAIEIDAPIEAVWKALTEASELVRWFPLEAGEEPDGTLWMSWGEGTRFSGRSELSEPPRRARFVYPQPPPGADPTSLTEKDLVEVATEFTLETRGGKTILRLVQSGFGPEDTWDDLLDATRSGWEFELRGLKHYLENHRGRDRTVAWVRRRYTASRDEAFQKLVAGWLEGVEENAPYAVDAPTGDRLEGTVLYLDPPKSVVATVDNLEASFLRIKLEDLYGLKEVNLWLSAYRLPEEDVRAFERRFQAWLDGLFGG